MAEIVKQIKSLEVDGEKYVSLEDMKRVMGEYGKAYWEVNMTGYLIEYVEERIG